MDVQPLMDRIVAICTDVVQQVRCETFLDAANICRLQGHDDSADALANAAKQIAAAMAEARQQ